MGAPVLLRTQRPQITEPGAGPLPLMEQELSDPSSYPFVRSPEEREPCGQTVVADPATDVSGESLDHALETPGSGALGEFAHPVLESADGFGVDGYQDSVLSGKEPETEELHIAGVPTGTLVAVDPEFHLLPLQEVDA